VHTHTHARTHTHTHARARAHAHTRTRTHTHTHTHTHTQTCTKHWMGSPRPRDTHLRQVSVLCLSHTAVLRRLVLPCDSLRERPKPSWPQLRFRQQRGLPDTQFCAHQSLTPPSLACAKLLLTECRTFVPPPPTHYH
jgi:hypothetical protein